MTDSNNQIAVVGPKDIVGMFAACGFVPFFCDTTTPHDIIEKIVDRYPLILVTEPVDDIVRKYASVPYPIIMRIPKGV